MFDLTTIGEGQIRLTVPQGERLSNTRQLRTERHDLCLSSDFIVGFPGETERLARGLPRGNGRGAPPQAGRHPVWVSVLPHSDLAERCISEFRSVGVDMSNMIRVPEGRVALYFMEPGEPPMPSRVT